MDKTDIDNRFPVVLRVPPRKSELIPQTSCFQATIRRSTTTQLHLVVCQVPSDTVYGNFLFLTKASSDKPLAAIVQRLTSCGSQHFQEDFVSKLGREIHAYTGTVLHADHSLYTVNTENDRGLIAMLPPYLDALFRPAMTDAAYTKHIHAPACMGTDKGGTTRKKGHMYRDLLELAKQKHRRANIDELVYPRGTPYAFNYQGSAEALVAVRLEESRAFHQHYYRPSNCFIVLAGVINEYDILAVLKAFEDELPSECIEDCRRLSSKLACPSQPTSLLRPDLFQLFPREAKEGLTEEERRRSLALSPGLRVRFVSEVLERTARQRKEENPIPKSIRLHLACQGPDVFDHSAFTAFLILAHHFLDTLKTGPWEDVTLDIKERKYPLAIFTFHHLDLTEVDNATQEFSKIVKACLSYDERRLKVFVKDLVEKAANETVQQVKWRADYDTVKSVVWWLAGCSLNSPGAAESFCCAVHPARDFEIMLKQKTAWWKSVVQKAYSDPILVLEPDKGGPVTLDTVTRPLGASSRYSMSSLASERAFPLPEELDEEELFNLKPQSFSHLQRRPKEIDWCKDAEVSEYCKEIGCYDLRELYGG